MTSINIYSVLESKPHNSHYLKRYYNFILGCQSKNKNLTKEIYIENHHICPRAKDLFPEYFKLSQFSWNSVNLTARQHYIAHHLLWKAYPKTSMSYVFKCFCDGYTSKCLQRYVSIINSKMYSELKQNQAEYNSSIKKNKVNVLNLETNERYMVSKQEYDSSDNLVGSCYGNRHFKSEETKQKMRKPKSKDHVAKIAANTSKMRTTPFVCCLVTRKTYTSLAWTKHYRILYETGYLDILGKTLSEALKGKPKSKSHVLNFKKSIAEKNKINRVSDIITHKEYSLSAFKRCILNKMGNQ